MVRRTINNILLILTLFGCSQKSESSSEETDLVVIDTGNVDFKQFLDNIPNAILPLTIECGFEKTINHNVFEKKYSEFIPKDFEIVGKLNVNREQNLILFGMIGDIIYPYLFSFDDIGQKIDSVYLHISTCSGDPNFESSTWSVIDKNVSINMTDTVKYYNYFETDNDYERNLDSTVVTKRSIKMDDKGRFIQIAEESEKK